VDKMAKKFDIMSSGALKRVPTAEKHQTINEHTLL